MQLDRDKGLRMSGREGSQEKFLPWKKPFRPHKVVSTQQIITSPLSSATHTPPSHIPSSSSCTHSKVTSNVKGLVKLVGLSSTTMLVKFTSAIMCGREDKACVRERKDGNGELDAEIGGPARVVE